MTKYLNYFKLFTKFLNKKDFDREPGCVLLVKQAFAAMNDLYKKQDYKTLSSKFQLCNAISDEAGYHHLLLWLRNAFTIMAMVCIKALIFLK